MEEEPRDLIVLGAIRNGNKSFDKIRKAARVEPEELNRILEELEDRGLIEVREKKGWLGKKIEMETTKKGETEIDERVHEMQTRWNQMSAIYKTGDKKKLKQYMDENRSFLPTMMFFGVMDMVLFSMMFGMMGMAISDYVPAQDVPAGMDGAEDVAGDGLGDGGFDIDIGF